MSQLKSNVRVKYFVLLFIIIFALFPTQNSTPDSWAYATDIKYGNLFFRPHHLLYNALGYVIYNFVYSLTGQIDVLSFMKFLNAIYAGLSLYLLSLILKSLHFDNLTRILWIIFVGGSFGVMRFSTDNEAYILPILLSLTGSYFFIRYHINESKLLILYSGFFAALACLMHQIMFFWWFGILIGLLVGKNWKSSFFYIVSSLIVPLSYWVIYKIGHHEGDFSGFVRYVFHDYFAGTATTNLNWKNFVLTPVSFVRTFMQIHGNIIIILKKSWFAWIFLVITVSSIVFMTRQKRSIEIKRKININEVVIAHGSIFLLQLLFAFFSHGNAEFMVMIPYLIAILLPHFVKIRPSVLIFCSLAMFSWNFGLAILPSALFKYYDNRTLIEQIKVNSNAIFLVSDKIGVIAECEYFYGDSMNQRIYGFLIDDDLEKISSFNNEDVLILTDIYDRPEPINRAVLTQEYSGVYKRLERIRLVQKLKGFYGTYGLYQVRIK